MDAFPAFFPLAGRRVVVVGEGPPADNKAALFEGSPAELVRLTEAEALAGGAFDGAALVFIAAADAALIAAAGAAARAAGAVVNVVDHPEACDFYTPAVIDRGLVVAAVSATGAAPLLSAKLRNDIEAQLPDGVGRLAALLQATRETVRQALPDMDLRRAFLRAAMGGPAARAAMDGDMATAKAMLEAALKATLAESDAGPAPAGRVDFIVGDGPADLTSLRAARALGQADVVIADPRCPPQIAAMARRDSLRRPLSDLDPTALAALAGAGRRVACVLAESPDPALAEAVRRAGAAAEVLRQASGEAS
jgi:precorrin-2 dehydrogenase/sirohydrochlorin ferrochelatase